MKALVMLAVALFVAACTSLPTPPPPTPGSMDDVIAALVRRDVRVHRLISGDAGCPSQPLHDNAVHLEVAVGDQSALKHIYLFRWRRQADYDAAAGAFARCVQEFGEANPDASISSIGLAPWRAYGPWDPIMTRLVDEAIRSTGGAPAASPT